MPLISNRNLGAELNGVRVKIPVSAMLGATLLIFAVTAALAEGGGPHGHILERFERIDGDGDGRITLDDIRERRARRFAEADGNRDGDLSLEELEVMIEKRRKEHMARRHARLDVNGDGVVSADEFSTAGDHWFNRADANNDGAVTRDELQSLGFHGKP